MNQGHLKFRLTLFSKFFFIGLVSLGLLSNLVSCVSLESSSQDYSFIPAQGGPHDEAVIKQVLATARSLLGQKPEARVTVKGKAFVLDCIGTVSAAWWGAGIDIQKDFSQYSGNGVTRLYKSLAAGKVLHQQKKPQPGDIVFWDNTWDANGDGIFGNDGHTHAGIVMQVDNDGTVHYLHESASRGIVISYMNPLHPKTIRDSKGKTLNSPMYLGAREGKSSNPSRWLSGDLWEAFGDGFGIVEFFGP